MYRMYLDEVGTDGSKRLDSDKHRYLSLTGVIIDLDHARDYLQPALNQIKGRALAEDPDSPICLHRIDIRNAKGPFECLRDEDKRGVFNEGILRILHDCDYKVVTAMVDKQEMEMRTHWVKTHPYHFLMEIMIEKYAKYLNRMDDIGDIMPEARGKPQDKALQIEFENYREKGTRFAASEFIVKRIRTKNLKFRTKRDNIAGLQLCDLVAHPSHYAVRHQKQHDVYLGDFCKKVVNILVTQKYDRSPSGDIWGFGAKYMP